MDNQRKSKYSKPSSVRPNSGNGGGGGSGSGNRPLSDAEYARRLQEEYRREFLQRRASAPVEERPVNIEPIPPPVVVDDEAYARQLQKEIEREERLFQQARQSSTNGDGNRNRRKYEITPIFNSPSDEDERLAQQFQDEEIARQLAAKPRTPSSRSRQPSQRQSEQQLYTANIHTHTQAQPSELRHCDLTPMTSSTASDTSSDELARRIAQEMDDAEIAQRLTLYEQETQARQQQEQRQNRTSRLLFGRVLPLLCCGTAVAVALLFILGVFDPQNVPFVGDMLKGDDWVDPFAGDTTVAGDDGSTPVVNSQDQISWPTDGRSGISLEILNALEDKWQTVLLTAVENWDKGFPVDPLSLTITRVSYEYECASVNGKIKVCNGNYGDTRWRGLNELMLNRRTNTIVSSAAKMNEFYLANDKDDQKLYTMCHELGHGFGLPHWDEDFFNKDLGNCMDYTNNPSKNMWPDATNFLFLSQIYGGVNVTTGEIVSSMSSVQNDSENDEYLPDADGSVEMENDHEDEKKDDKKRSRRRAVEYFNKQSPKRGLRTLSTKRNSKVVLSETEKHQSRRILELNEHFEVHQVVDGDDGDGDIVKIQIYLMV